MNDEQSKDLLVVGSRAGHEIALNAQRKFVPFGPLIEKGHHLGYPTYEQAVEAVDKATKTKEIEDRTKLALPVVNPAGGKATIKGIHAGHGKLLFLEGRVDTEGYGFATSLVYPDIGWIRAALLEVGAHRKALHELEAKLCSVAISAMRSMSHATPAGFEDALAALVTEHRAKTEEALRLAPQEPEAPPTPQVPKPLWAGGATP
jgi:hypothetical protein